MKTLYKIAGGTAAVAVLGYGGLTLVAQNAEDTLRTLLQRHAPEAKLSVERVEPLVWQGKTRLHGVRVTFEPARTHVQSVSADSLDVGLALFSSSNVRLQAEGVTLKVDNDSRPITAASVRGALAGNVIQTIDADDLQLKGTSGPEVTLARLHAEQVDPTQKTIARAEGETLVAPNLRGYKLQIDKLNLDTLAPGRGKLQLQAVRADDAQGNALKIDALSLQAFPETGIALKIDNLTETAPLFNLRARLLTLGVSETSFKLRIEDGGLTPTLPAATSALSRAGLPPEIGMTLDVDTNIDKAAGANGAPSTTPSSAPSDAKSIRQTLSLKLKDLLTVATHFEGDIKTEAQPPVDVLLRKASVSMTETGHLRALQKIVMADASITPEAQNAAQVVWFRSFLPDEAQVQAWQTAFTTFDRDGGTLIVSADPAQPQSIQSLVFMMLLNPKEATRAINTTARHQP